VADLNAFNGQGWLTFGEKNDGVEELPEGDVAVAVRVDEAEEVLHEVGVDLHTDRVRKLFLQNNGQ